MATISDELTLEIKRVAGTKRLPTLPAVAQKLIEIAQNDEIEIHEVCQAVRSDPAMCGKILKTANSVLFGFRSRIDTLEQAVPKLGTSMIRTLILSFHLAAQSDNNSKHQVYERQLWRNFLTQAVFAELIAEKTGCDPSICFMGGLLQDIGILAMFAEFESEYIKNVLERAVLPEVAAAEKRHFGYSHIEVSKEVVHLWNLDQKYEDAIGHHHDVIAPVNQHDGLLNNILQAANLGASVISASRPSTRHLDDLLQIWISYLELHFEFEQDVAQYLISEVHERVREYSIVFDFKIGDGVRVDQIIAEAKEILQEYAIKSQLEAMTATAKKARELTPEKNELFRDCLTGLYNRRFVNEIVNSRIESWIDKQKPIAMLFMDVDKFKCINDEYGHKIGDQAIVHVARWIQEVTRDSDFAIRLGGDEFLVIMQLKEMQCEKIAERIANEIPPLVLDDEETIPVSLSVGCIYYQPKRDDSFNANWLIDRADQLMYRVKKNGGAGLSIQKS